MPASLLERRLHFVVGKGGVGKTTVAAALALTLARRGRRTLAVDMEPGRRLAGLLGREADPRLSVLHVDGRAALEEYLNLVIPVKRLLATVFASKIYQYFVAAAPGLKELMTVGKIWYEATRSEGGRPRRAGGRTSTPPTWPACTPASATRPSSSSRSSSSRSSGSRSWSRWRACWKPGWRGAPRPRRASARGRRDAARAGRAAPDRHLGRERRGGEDDRGRVDRALGRAGGTPGGPDHARPGAAARELARSRDARQRGARDSRRVLRRAGPRGAAREPRRHDARPEGRVGRARRTPRAGRGARPHPPEPLLPAPLADLRRLAGVHGDRAALPAGRERRLRPHRGRHAAHAPRARLPGGAQADRRLPRPQGRQVVRAPVLLGRLVGAARHEPDGGFSPPPPRAGDRHLGAGGDLGLLHQHERALRELPAARRARLQGAARRGDRLRAGDGARGAGRGRRRVPLDQDGGAAHAAQGRGAQPRPPAVPGCGA